MHCGIAPTAKCNRKRYVAGHNSVFLVLIGDKIAHGNFKIPVDFDEASPDAPGRVEDWRHGSVGPAYLLLPVSVGSASLTEP